MQSLRNVYAGKRVLVTGHTGFKGSWLSLWLDSLGASVSGLALEPPTEPAMYDVCRLDEVVNSNIADIRDLDAVREVFDCSSPEVLFHLAAQPIVRDSYEDPVATYATNVMGTVNVMEAACTCSSVRAIVIVTSDKCYENYEWERAYTESDSLGGHDPYSSSKACTEIVASAYARSFFGPFGASAAVATARAGNVIGGGDWGTDRIVPDAVRALSMGEPLRVRNPGSVRPWQHVLESMHGYLMLAERLLTGEMGSRGAWNFGPGDASMLPVGDLADLLVGCWESGEWVDISGSEAPHEASLLRLDNSKAIRELGWKPVLGLKQAVELTAAWYRAYYAGEDVRALTIDQIKAFDRTAEEVVS